MNSSFLGIFEAKNNVLKLIVLASSQDFRKCCVSVCTTGYCKQSRRQRAAPHEDLSVSYADLRKTLKKHE